MYQQHDKPLHLYAGPTLAGISLTEDRQEGVVMHPPVRRGDISQLISEEMPGSIAIVDGTFHAYPAVGHAEIMRALELGWNVWGLSSMGAIRATEMHSFGMRGFGHVFRAYRDRGLSDDEVALLHQETSPFLNLSEPLIHIRSFVRELVSRRVLTQEAGRQIIIRLKSMWYGNRTHATLQQYLIQEGITEEQAAILMLDLHHFQLKKHDLIEFLAIKPWLS